MWPSYLINLTDNTVRLENSKRQFDEQKITFSRIDAINGWEMSDEQISQVYDAQAANKHYKYQMIKPEIGCYLSHIQAWQQIVDSGAPGGFVFEDDFISAAPLKPVLEALTQSEDKWDMAKLFSIKEHPKIMRWKSLTPFHDLVVPFQIPTCLLAYAIRSDAAKKLIETSIPFFRPVDEDLKYFWEKNISVSLVHPSPVKVGDQQTKTGTIGGARRTDTRKARIWRRWSYQLKYKSLLYFHRFTGAWR